MSYQEQVQQMQKAGFSGQDVQDWSDNQAVQMRQAGFNDDEVNGFQGKAPPAAPGGTPIYGRVPTDDDFHNAASVIMSGDDHPLFHDTLETLKNLHAQTGVGPAEAVKISQTIPSFQKIMENGSSVDGSYWQEAGRGAGSAIAEQLKGLSVIQANSKNETDRVAAMHPGNALYRPLFDTGLSSNPEENWFYKKGVALQKWVDDKFPQQASFEAAHPIKTGVVSGFAQIPELVATLGTGMAAGGANNAYQEARQAGSTIPQASHIASNAAMLWGVLGVTDVGAFIKPIERSAPGFLPWLMAKGAQAVRGGTTFAGTNELGDYLTTQIAHASDVPLEYKPTLQRIVINALTGAVAGGVGRTNLREEPLTPSAAAGGPSEGSAPPPRGSEPPPEPPTGGGTAAQPPRLTPAYHFDSDTYGLKDSDGHFVQTGLQSEADAKRVADAQEAVNADAPARPGAAQPRLEPAVIDRYKKTVLDEANRLGFNLTPEQLQTAATKMAESHNPPKVEGASEEGGQGVIPGAERISDKKLAERHMEGTAQAGKPQKAADEGLFDVAARGQGDLLDRAANTEEIKKRAAQKTPMNAMQFIASKGGIWDEVLNGDLRAMDAHKRYGQIMRKNGMSVDEMGQALHDAGYFGPPDTTARPTTNDVLEIIRKSLNGEHTYSDFDRARVEQRQETVHGRNYRGQLEDDADRLNVDHAGMTNEQLEDALRHANAVEQAKIEYNHELSDADVEQMEREGMQGYYGPNWRPEHETSGKEQSTASAGTRGGERSEVTPRATPEGAGGGGRGGPGNEVQRELGESGATSGDAERYIGKHHLDDVVFQPALTRERLDNLGDFSRRNMVQVSRNLYGETSEKFTIHEADLLSAVQKEVSRILPNGSVEARAFRSLRNLDNDRISGARFKDMATRVIAWSLENRRLTGDEKTELTQEDVLHTVRHEAIHDLERMGILTEKELSTLHDSAVDKGWLEKHNVEERWGKLGLSDSEKQSEAIAEEFADWSSSRQDKRTTFGKIFSKIKDFLDGISSKVRSILGTDATSDDIFRNISSGEIGKRAATQEGEGTAFQSAKEDEKKPTIGDAIRAIRDTISPTSAGEKAKQTEQVLRSSYGQAKRQQAIAESALKDFARQAATMDDAQRSDFYNYVEGRSRGAQLENKQFQAMADAVRGVYSDFKDTLQAMPENRMMHFVTDYFTHQWAPGQEAKIQDFMNHWWQQGSARNLKERKIPTIADGLSYGLELAEPNPVRAVSRYVSSMSNYIASVNVLRAINQDLGGGYYADGKQPEGYSPLVGRNAERIENARVDPESGKLVPARKLQLYAPQQVADLYNSWYSKGFEDTKLATPYMMLRNAINANTMLELSLSAYHFSTINVQSLNQDMGRILRNMIAGDWEGVGNAVKGLATPGAHFFEGQKLSEQYKGLADHGIDMERIAHLFAQSNARLGLDPLQNISTHAGFYKAWQRGELPALRERLTQQLSDGHGIGAIKTGAEVVGRMISDISHPLFNVYVPAMKMSAFHDLMGDWMRQNPGATDGEINHQALRIGDLVEDRFGEMNMENIFWNKKAKELMGLTLRAPGWDIGLVRQTGGAAYDVYRMLKDAATGKGIDPARLDRPLFMAGSAMVYVAMNSLMTYIKTGKQPTDQEQKDWLAYATGGKHQAFGLHPERVELPGHARELIQMAPEPGKGPLSGIVNEAKNKTASLPKHVGEILMNEDWKGKPIYDPKSKNWSQRIPGVAQAAHLAEGFKPFSMENLFNPQPGSNMSFAERFLGSRAAGAKIVNPEGLRQFNERKTH